MNYNKAQIMGRLVRDIELNYTAGGMAVGKATIAVSRKYKDKEETLFMPCTFFGKTAEIAQKYTSKGSALFVDGRLNQNSWDDKETGKKRSSIELVVETMQFVGAKGDNAGSPAPASRQAAPTDDEDKDDVLI